MVLTDWDPTRYGAFRDLRLRPALDLLAQVPELPSGAVVDLGCGNGAVAADLAVRFPGRTLVGVDSSVAMLDDARDAGHYHRMDQADIARWAPHQPPALIFSNAALQWLGDHTALMPRLVGMLAAGGVLAVQMPAQSDAPSHRLLREVAETMFPGRFLPSAPFVLTAEAYARLLSPLGDVSAWTTVYIQRLRTVSSGHPVRAFTESTAMRPYAGAMTHDEAEAYVAAYDRALADVYPVLPSGEVLFPFTRVFFVLERI
jgi:trans-aconitate 2-methyltransferase